ncbi:hypothetical protein APHAL10511_005325 [Amanita phalloides]|nr:hypothetical protein APHAL10511_005325 [Amanita phalloides]
MPEKHVRFASTNDYLAVPAGRASRSASPASSIGPLTPPSHTFPLPGPTPYALPSLTKSRTVNGRVHTLLEYSTSPVIGYDFIDPPSALKVRREGVSSRLLSEPATSPPLQSLTLTSPHLPWRIPVAARNGTFVSVFDVIDSVYRCLRTHVSESEYHLLPTRADQERANAAYRQRYRRLKDPRAYDDEKRQGLRRIDFLMGHSKFRGLSRTDSGPTSWFLNCG